jgi:hypothetical protein
MVRQVPLISRFTAALNFVGTKGGCQKLYFLSFFLFFGGDVNSKYVLFSEPGEEQSAVSPYQQSFGIITIHELPSCWDTHPPFNLLDYVSGDRGETEVC